VAEYNLETFLTELTGNRTEHGIIRSEYLLSVCGFFGCLSNAVGYIHGTITKHMDIKPQNILVRYVKGKRASHSFCWKVYLADFGIARSYSSIAASETEGPTKFTRKYAPPEVVDWDKRGLPADIFSLGCVFVEITAAVMQATVIRRAPVAELETRLAANENGDSSYQANILAVQNYLSVFKMGSYLRDYLQFWLKFAHEVISRMLEPRPENRPTARVLTAYFANKSSCCSAATTADPLEDAPPMPEEEDFENHMGDFNLDADNWSKRPPSPENLNPEKRSSFRKSCTDLSSTSDLMY
jgi:serine/threonine protein kinase